MAAFVVALIFTDVLMLCDTGTSAVADAFAQTATVMKERQERT